MSVPFDLLPLFPKLLPIYRHLYREELLECERKMMTRNLVAGGRRRQGGGGEEAMEEEGGRSRKVVVR
jgi:hypothetical protein